MVLFAAPDRKFRSRISQRRGASLRRLLVKCGLSPGGCWATQIPIRKGAGTPAHLRSRALGHQIGRAALILTGIRRCTIHLAAPKMPDCPASPREHVERSSPAITI